MAHRRSTRLDPPADDWTPGELALTPPTPSTTCNSFTSGSGEPRAEATSNYAAYTLRPPPRSGSSRQSCGRNPRPACRNPAGLTAFDTALFTLAAVAIVRQRFAMRFHPIGLILARRCLGPDPGGHVPNCDVQRRSNPLSLDRDCAAFCLALRWTADRPARQRFLTRS